MLTLQIRGDGPIEGITVTADSHANVKGYVGNPDVMLPAKEWQAGRRRSSWYRSFTGD